MVKLGAVGEEQGAGHGSDSRRDSARVPDRGSELAQDRQGVEVVVEALLEDLAGDAGAQLEEVSGHPGDRDDSTAPAGWSGPRRSVR